MQPSNTSNKEVKLKKKDCSEELWNTLYVIINTHI